MSATGDAPSARNGPSAKTRSRREVTSSGHLPTTCRRMISALVRNPCRHRSRGGRRASSSPPNDDARASRSRSPRRSRRMRWGEGAAAWVGRRQGSASAASETEAGGAAAEAASCRGREHLPGGVRIKSMARKDRNGGVLTLFCSPQDWCSREIPVRGAFLEENAQRDQR
jgi:hypothetical protein